MITKIKESISLEYRNKCLKNDTNKLVSYSRASLIPYQHSTIDLSKFTKTCPKSILVYNASG